MVGQRSRRCPGSSPASMETIESSLTLGNDFFFSFPFVLDLGDQFLGFLCKLNYVPSGMKLVV